MHQWLRQAPIDDPVARRLASPLQASLVIMAAVVILAMILNVIVLGPSALTPSGLAPNGLVLLTLLGALALLRRGFFKLTLWIVIGALLLAQAYSMLTPPFENSVQALMIFAIPITLAGLFLGRGALVVTITISVAMVTVGAAQDSLTLHAPAVVVFTLAVGVLAALQDLFRSSLRLALHTAQAQAEALERLQVENITLYHQAESERERLQVTLASIGDAVITTDTDGKVTFLNNAAEALTNWRSEQAAGRPLEEVFRIANESTGEPIESPIRRVLTEGAIVGLANHTVLHAADGRAIPIADSGAPIRDSRRRIIGAVLVFRDVTEERAAQVALEASEARFREMADNAPALVWTAAPDKGCIYLNQRWLDFTGTTLEAALGFGWADGIHPEDVERVMEIYDTAFDARKPFTMDYRLRRHDGEYCWFTDTGIPRYSSEGLFLGYIGSCIDITDRKLNEERTRLLQEITAEFSEALTREQVADIVVSKVAAMLESHLGTVYIVADDHLELLNTSGLDSAARKLYRRLDLNAPGPLLDAIREQAPVWIGTRDDYLQRYPQFATIVRNHDSYAIAGLPLIVDGRVIGGMTFSFGRPMTFDAPTRRFIVALAQQCAQALERARLFDIEAAARREAEKANLLKLQFLGMVSHELRTPLTSIKGFTSTLLATDVTWDEKTEREFLAIIDSEADKLAELIDQLLELSRLQAGNLRIQPTPQDFRNILDLASTEINTLTTGHQLTSDVAPNLPPIMADARRIAQVLTNLIDNAAKYSPPGTRIGLSARLEDGMVRVDVSDEGEGVPLELRESVFEPFLRLQQGHEVKGAGLGLAVCRGLIDAHGGRIWIEPREGAGSIFSFTLPVVKDNAG